MNKDSVKLSDAKGVRLKYGKTCRGEAFANQVGKPQNLAANASPAMNVDPTALALIPHIDIHPTLRNFGMTIVVGALYLLKLDALEK